MRWLLLALVTLQSATCGQKGPLTLPDPEPSRATQSGSSANDEAR